jgi:hypothetical protein
MNGNPGAYTIVLTSDDGARLYVNNVLQIDNWRVQAPTTKTSSFNYTGGPVQVRVEYFDQAGGAEIEVHLVPNSGGIVSGVPVEQPATGGSCGPLVGSIAYVNVASLNFRDGPSTTFPVITTQPQCTAVETTGYRNPVGSNAGNWVQVVMLNDGRVAWALADYLTMAQNVNTMTVLSD